MRPGQAAPVFFRMAFNCRLSFKSPSMRPGQAAPVFSDAPALDRTGGHPSMRPGQAAPVFCLLRIRAGRLLVPFNEAGAGCPGILPSISNCSGLCLTLQ